MAMAPRRHQPRQSPAKPDWRHYDRSRGTRQDRGYDEVWLRLAKLIREEQHYLCQECLRNGREVVAQGPIDPRTGKHREPPVDHVIPVEVQPDLRLEPSNLQVLCLSCHARKTRSDKRKYGL